MRRAERFSSPSRRNNGTFAFSRFSQGQAAIQKRDTSLYMAIIKSYVPLSSRKLALIASHSYLRDLPIYVHRFDLDPNSTPANRFNARSRIVIDIPDPSRFSYLKMSFQFTGVLLTWISAIHRVRGTRTESLALRVPRIFI